MQIIGLARLGRDAEIRTTPSGEKVTNLSLAFNYGRKDADGKRPTQWVEGALWGKLAEALIDYLVKGQAVCVTINDPHIEQYEARDGSTGHKLAGTITSIELAGRADGGQGAAQRPAAAPAPAPAPRPAPRAAAPAPSGFSSDMEDDIPF